ncbi:MAG: toprim domain-containing protein [[Eubacterium] siraeum]|nr:toprim domain-containing protein [[Eubacterium] siraeum]
MAHLEEDIIERAKNTDMIALLESEEGFSFKSTYGEREFKCIEHNSLVVNGNRRRWYWNSRQVGGNNAIDYLVKIRGMNFRDAVLHLVGDREQTAYTPIRKAVTENVSVSKPVRFVLPEQAHFPDGRRNYSNIIAYLNKGRGIDMNIINTLIASGQIYQGVQYNGLHIVGYNDEGMAFYRFNDNRDWVDYRLQTLRASPTATDTYQAEAVSSKYVDNILLKDNTKIFKNNLVVSTGKNAQGEISYAAFRIASTNYRFRGEVAGSDKASGFLIESEGMNDCVYVFESFIDAMSHANLYNIKYGNKDAWKLHNRLALGGTADTALMELLKRKPNIRNICLCLDNDSAGRTAAKEIAGRLRSMGYVNVYERYSNEKDYNDELKKVKSIINEQAEENEV